MNLRIDSVPFLVLKAIENPIQEFLTTMPISCSHKLIKSLLGPSHRVIEKFYLFAGSQGATPCRIQAVLFNRCPDVVRVHVR